MTDNDIGFFESIAKDLLKAKPNDYSEEFIGKSLET